MALAMPAAYCVLDAAGTFADSRVLEIISRTVEDYAASANVAYELAYLLIATPGFTIVRRDGKWGMLNDRGRPIVPCVYDAVYYKEGHTVIDTQADTSEAGKSVAAPNGGFREKLHYMQKEGETEIFTEKGRRVRGQ